MKIAMMSAWNTDSGVSVHAELIGRQWVKMGHPLQVFTFLPSDFHGTTLVGGDEPFIFRCFTTSRSFPPYLDPRPFLSGEYEVFVVQDLGMLPMDELAKIFPHIRRKAITLNIIHDNGPSPNPSFYQFEWDRIICFDHRYEAFLRRYHPEEKIQIIPFPCHPMKRGDQREARVKLGLPLEKKILLIFGQRIKEHLPLWPVLKELGSRLSFLLLIVSKKDVEGLEHLEEVEIEIRREAPSLDDLYDYLHASDVLILHRNPCDGVVVSSTAFQCLGSGCPILAYESSFFETLKDVVVTYSNFEEFKECLLDILNRGERYQSTRQALERFIEKNNAERVAREYIDLFQTLIEERKAKELDQVSRILRAVGTLPIEPSRERQAFSFNQESGKGRLQPH
ncbi:MAG: hypothetical protein ACUVT6_03545 [Thermodesulfobacteriota bacterium]